MPLSYLNNIYKKNFLLLFVLISFASHGQEVRTPNYMYDLDAKLRLDHVFASGGDEVTLFLRLGIKPGNLIDDFIIRYTFQDFQSTYEIDPRSFIESDSLRNGKVLHYYRLTMSADDLFSMFITITDRKTDEQFKFELKLKSDLMFPKSDLVLMEAERNIPIFESYLKQNTPFRVVPVYNSTTQFIVYHYNSPFKAALPPWPMEDTPPPPELKVDSTFTIKLNEKASLSGEGLYFIQSDSSTMEGISIYSTFGKFPQTPYLENMIEQVLYISTSEEYDMLKANPTKKSLDKYWLGVNSYDERAKRILKTYYKRVWEANAQFSQYKDGWKTDMGMVYIIYGPPNEVEQKRESETWTYKKTRNMERVRFTFNQRKNLFTDRHFELARDNSYREIWYRTIDLWRKGIRFN